MRKMLYSLAILAVVYVVTAIPVVAHGDMDCGCFDRRGCTNLNINDVALDQHANARSVYGDVDASNIANTFIDQSQRNRCSSDGYYCCRGTDCTNLNINDIDVDQCANTRSVYGDAEASNIANTFIDQSQSNICFGDGYYCCRGTDCTNLNINVVNIYQTAISISVFGDAKASNIAEVDLSQNQENRCNGYIMHDRGSDCWC